MRDEYKLLKIDLDAKNEAIARMQAELQQSVAFATETKKSAELKEASLDESVKKERALGEKLDESSKKIATLTKKLDEYELSFKQLKSDLDVKKDSEKELQGDKQRLNVKIDDLGLQLKEKVSEIEFLNRENNSLQERIDVDEKKLATLDAESKLV